MKKKNDEKKGCRKATRDEKKKNDVLKRIFFLGFIVCKTGKKYLK